MCKLKELQTGVNTLSDLKIPCLPLSSFLSPMSQRRQLNKSTKERLARLGAAPDTLEEYVNSLENSFHFKKLALPTQCIHDQVCKLWEDYAISINLEPSKIIPGLHPPLKHKHLSILPFSILIIRKDHIKGFL